MNEKLDRIKWSLIVSSPTWFVFGLFLILFQGLYTAWEVEPILAILLMCVVLFIKPKNKFREVDYNDLSSEDKKQLNDTMQKLQNIPGVQSVELRKIETDDEP